MPSRTRRNVRFGRLGASAAVIAAVLLGLTACGQGPPDNLAAPDYGYQIPLHARSLEVIFSPSGWGTIERTGGWVAQVDQRQADAIAAEVNGLPRFQDNCYVIDQQPADSGAWFGLNFVYENGVHSSSLRIDASGCRSVWQSASYSPYKSAFTDANLFDLLQQLPRLPT